MSAKQGRAHRGCAARISTGSGGKRGQRRQEKGAGTEAVENSSGRIEGCSYKSRDGTLTKARTHAGPRQPGVVCVKRTERLKSVERTQEKQYGEQKIEALEQEERGEVCM